MTYKDFLTGAVFTASDADLLMRQGLIVVSNAAARDAIVSPAEGMRVYRLDTHGIERYTGSGWTNSETVTIPLQGGYAGTLTARIADGYTASVMGHFNSRAYTDAGCDLFLSGGGLPAAYRPAGNQSISASAFIVGTTDYTPAAVVIFGDGAMGISQRSGAARTGVCHFEARFTVN